MAETQLRLVESLLSRPPWQRASLQSPTLKNVKFVAEHFVGSPYVDEDGQVLGPEQIDADNPLVAMDIINDCERLWNEGSRSKAVEEIGRAVVIAERACEIEGSADVTVVAGLARLKQGAMLSESGETRSSLPAARAAVRHFGCLIDSGPNPALAGDEQDDLELYCAALLLLAKVQERLGQYADEAATRAELDRVAPASFRELM